jgi:hypothetical protein
MSTRPNKEHALGEQRRIQGAHPPRWATIAIYPLVQRPEDHPELIRELLFRDSPPIWCVLAPSRAESAVSIPSNR